MDHKTSKYPSHIVKANLRIICMAPQDFEVLAVLDLWVPCSSPYSRRSHDGNKNFGNPGRRGRRRPAEAWSYAAYLVHIYDLT